MKSGPEGQRPSTVIKVFIGLFITPNVSQKINFICHTSVFLESSETFEVEMEKTWNPLFLKISNCLLLLISKNFVNHMYFNGILNKCLDR